MGNFCSRRQPLLKASDAVVSSRQKSRLLTETQAPTKTNEGLNRRAPIAEDEHALAQKNEGLKRRAPVAEDGVLGSQDAEMPCNVIAGTGGSHSKRSSQDEDATLPSAGPADANRSADISKENVASLSPQQNLHSSSAYRDLIMTGDSAGIELVMRVAKDILLNPSDVKFRSVKQQAIHRRVGGNAESVFAALQAAGFTCSDDILKLPIDRPLEPLHGFIRLAERTRDSYWKPTPAPQPIVEIKPDAWHMLVSPEAGGYVIAEKDAELWSQTFRRTGNEARTWKGGQTPRVTVTFMNWSESQTLTFSWIDSRSLNPTEERWGELEPKRDVDQRTFVSHAWVIRLANGHAVAGYVPIDPGPGAHHFVSVGQHQHLPSRRDFEALVQERAARAMDQSTDWRDAANVSAAPAVAHPPRDRSEHWGVVAWPLRSGMAVAEAESESWAATHRGVGMEGRIWQGARTQKVELVFVNCSRERVAVSWLDINNQWRERYDYDVEVDASREQGTYIYHAFSFRDVSGRAVGGYVPMDVSDSVRHVVFFGPREFLPLPEDLHGRALSYL